MLENLLNEIKNAVSDKKSGKYVELLGEYSEQMNIKNDSYPVDKINLGLGSFLKNQRKKHAPSCRRSIVLSDEQIQKLKANKNVECINYGNVYYTLKFKKQAVCEYVSGKSPEQIFADAGFNLKELSKRDDYASSLIQRWKRELAETVSEQASYQELVKQNEYLKLENEILKKIITEGTI